MAIIPAAKLVPVGYGISKLVISCVVEDDKVITLVVVMSYDQSCTDWDG